MKKYGVLRLVVGSLLLMASAYLLPGQVVDAQVKTTVTKPKGLTLSPLRSELGLAPGTSLDGTLTVTNSTDKPMKVSLSAEEFSVINRQYDYAFTTESDVTKWVTFSTTEVNLKAGESKKLSYSLGAPLTAEPGGRYISLFVGTDTETQDGGVISRQRIASLLYITVLGDVTRAGHLVSLASPWVISGKSRWSVALRNTGTTHFRSRYNVSVQSVLGSSEVAASTGDALILPGTVRVVSDVLPAPQLPGLYKVVYTIGLGDTPATVETRWVFYMPPLAIAGSAVAVILIISVMRRRLSNKL